MTDNPDVHRDLVVQDPPLHGRDVANLQRAIELRLRARDLEDDVPVPTHGKFTHATWVACVEAGYFLGLLSSTYLETHNGHGLMGQGAQTIMRHPNRRSAEQLQRADDRRAQVDRGPRYYDELAHKTAPRVGKGPDAALTYLGRHLGLHESPAGSNWGPVVEDWIRLAGYTSPVPWCGCATNAALVSAGIPSGAPWGIGYCPSVRRHAQAGLGGWSWHSDGQRGDVILFAGPDGLPEHQGLVFKRLAAGHYLTREGNTSKGDGSQSDGGMVAERNRVSVPGFRIAGFARPPWKA
jgi:hypothetical protein